MSIPPLRAVCGIARNPSTPGSIMSNHDLIRVLGGQPLPRRPIAGEVNRVSLPLEPALEQPGHPGFVLNHKHSHGQRLRSRRCENEEKLM